MHETSRRDFLKAAIGSTVGVGSSWPLLVGQGATRETSSEARSRVAAIRGNNLDAITREAIDALGGMRTVVAKGETVFIKPNFVTFPWAKHNHCFRVGECTKPEIVIAVTEECLREGAAEVIIGEGAHLPKFDWQYATTLDGSTNLVKEVTRLTSRYAGKVTLACLEIDSPSWVEVPSKTPLNKIAISSLVAKADKVISIPVAKTHSSTSSRP